MSKKANPTMVGTFVLGAVFLAITGIITFSKSQFFTKETTFVCYFDSSLVGLDVGAPVRFQGIRVGTVRGMEGVIDPDSLEVDVPVYVDLVRGSMRTTREQADFEEDEESLVRRLIDKGLRAELLKDSLVTGKLYVALEFDPESEVRLIGHDEHPEIPTITGGFEKLAKNIEEIDFEGLVSSTTEAVQAVEKLVENPEIAELIHNINELVQNVNEEVDPLSTSAQTLMTDADKLINDSDREIVELSDEAKRLIQGFDTDREKLTAQLEEAMSHFNAIDGDYAMTQKTSALIDELTAAARAIRILADYLERHPEALIKGKN